MKRFIRNLFLASTVACMSIASVAVPLVGLTVAVVPLTGCNPPSPEQIAADGKALGIALNAVANLTANPNTAASLHTAANDIVAATANWQTGSSTAIINSIAQATEVVLGSIPTTEFIAPLVAIAVAALDSLIANVPPPPAQVSAGRSYAMNPYRGKAHIHHMLLRSPEGDLKAAWNGEVKKNPSLHAVPLIQ